MTYSPSSPEVQTATEVEFDEGEVVRCLIEAVMTKRAEAINWRNLTDNKTWLPDWK